MELKITEFFNNCAPMDFSASVAEIGRDAGPSTWHAACEESTESLILDTEEKCESFKDFVRSAGAWSDDEINAWSVAELNALCIQWISGDMREPVGFDLGAESTDEQWAEYQKQSEDGNVSGRLFKSADGEIYFYIGS
jgi:hypothetical protein